MTKPSSGSEAQVGHFDMYNPSLSSNVDSCANQFLVAISLGCQPSPCFGYGSLLTYSTILRYWQGLFRLGHKVRLDANLTPILKSCLSSQCAITMALSVDEMLDKIGSFGWYQIRMIFILSYMEWVNIAYQVMLLSFVAAEPAWHCVANSTVCTLPEEYRPGDADYDFRCGDNVTRADWEFSDSFTSIVTEVTSMAQRGSDRWHGQSTHPKNAPQGSLQLVEYQKS